MPNYQNGKIYSIRSKSRPDLIYIGSTTQRLSKRFSQHKAPTNESTSKNIIEIGDAYIELIENHPCDSKEELNRREGEVIRETDNCINLIISGRTRKEYYHENREEIIQRVKDWVNNNKDKRKNYRKEYYQLNKEKINEKRKEYYEDNKEKIAQRRKQWREENKEEISQKKKEKYQCECGSNIRKNDKARHDRSKKHQTYISTLNEQ